MRRGITDPSPGQAALPTDEYDRWSASAILAAGFVAAWLVLQVVIPAMALFEPRPSRLGWQMYSSLQQVPEAWTVNADGTTTEVDVHALFAVPRAEIDSVAVLRAGLCDLTGARAILVQPGGAAEPERVACR